MKVLLEGVFDIDSVTTKGKNEADDILRHSLTVKLSGVSHRDNLAFLFGVRNGEEEKDLFKPAGDLVPGYWDADGAPIDAEGQYKPSFKYPDCQVTVFEKIADKPSNREVVGRFAACDIKTFTLHPNYGHTFNIAMSFFTKDIEDDGADIGRMAVHTKREVYVKIERPDDLFDSVEDDEPEED